jgi:hypothetical protein
MHTPGAARTRLEDGPTVHAQSGLSLRSAGQDIEVSADARADGTQVNLVVTPRLGALQLIDWGEGAKFEREILDRLGGRGTGSD